MANRILLIATLGLFACASPDKQPSEEGRLFNEKWHLISMDGTRLSDKQKYQQYAIRIEKKRLSGNAVNQFVTPAQIHTDGTMQVSKFLQTTRKATFGRGSFLEKQYFSIIPTLTHWKKFNGRLELTGRKGKLIFIQ